MMDEEEETQDIIIQQQQIIGGGKGGEGEVNAVRRRSAVGSSRKIAVNKRRAKSRFDQPLAPDQPNPYLKKKYACEVELSSDYPEMS